MLRKLLAVLFLAAGVLGAAPAWASGDFGCSASWKLKLAEQTSCNNQPLLSPSNDSRVNLLLLLVDAGKAQVHALGSHGDRYDGPYPPLIGPFPFTLGDLGDMIAPPPPSAPGAPEASRVEGDGSRCNSNDDGAAAFAAALTASAVPANERAALLAARAALKPDCKDDPKAQPAAMPPVPAGSATGKLFAIYLAGADAFYGGRFDAAAQSFSSLQAANPPWLKETARYMLGRTALNKAQAGAFDEYGRLEMAKVDAKALAAAHAAFDAYLHDYPKGTYADSARGLLRRVDWLAARPGDLAQRFAQAFDAAGARSDALAQVDLVQEADAKLLSQADTEAGSIHDPLLLAAFDLQHMRAADAKTDTKFVTLPVLEAQKPLFKGREALFDYLRAAHALYIEDDPRAALALLPTATPTSAMSYLEFSRQALKAMALEQAKDAARARALWLALMPQARPPLQHAALELGLAMNYERAGSVDAAFAAGSPITDADMREQLLTYSAGAELLRRQAQAHGAPQRERQIALYALLYKEVTRGHYEAFGKDLALLPPPPKPVPTDQVRDYFALRDPDFDPFRWDGKTAEGYACPPLKALAQSLAKDPAGAGDRLCLAEFVRAGSLDSAAPDAKQPADELGGAASQFAGGPFSRLEIYKTLIADPKTPAAVRTYALYRAVQCYAPSGNNQCGGKDVPQSQRKAWFQTLKTTYGKSTWAQALKYYW